MQLDPENRLKFALAGNATFTLVSAKTGARFTYKITKAADRAPHFVKVLNGSDNVGDYAVLGSIFEGLTYRHNVRFSPIGADALSAQAFDWWWRNPESAQVELWHQGSCGRCGRALTVPASIESGLGPVCAGLMGAAA